MKINYILLIVFLISGIKLNAQNTYLTVDGHIMIIAKVNNKPIKAESHKLSLFLDYNSNTLKGSLDLKTLNIEIPSLAKKLKETEEPLIVKISGPIPSKDFLLHRHEPIHFNWPVTITFNNQIIKTGFKTTITHIDEGATFTCLVSAVGELQSSETELLNLIPELDKVLQIQFVQMILKKD
jgi:hypothetical protein